MLTQIIGVGAIDDCVESKLRSNLVEPGPELGFTVVAPVGRITEVTRIGQLVGIDLPQWDVELARDLMRRVCLNFWIRRAAPHDRNKTIWTERGGAHDRQHRRVHAPGVAEDDAAERVK